jgi:hypothetical protein
LRFDNLPHFSSRQDTAVNADQRSDGPEPPLSVGARVNTSAFRLVPIVESPDKVSPEAAMQSVYPQFDELGPLKVYLSEESANEDFQAWEWVL